MTFKNLSYFDEVLNLVLLRLPCWLNSISSRELIFLRRRIWNSQVTWTTASSSASCALRPQLVPIHTQNWKFPENFRERPKQGVQPLLTCFLNSNYGKIYLNESCLWNVSLLQGQLGSVWNLKLLKSGQRTYFLQNANFCQGILWLLGRHHRSSAYLCKVGGLWYRGTSWKYFQNSWLFPKVCALVLTGVLSYSGIFYVSVGMLDNIFLMFLPLLFGSLYILWVVPSRQILLQGLEEVCIPKRSKKDVHYWNSLFSMIPMDSVVG